MSIKIRKAIADKCYGDYSLFVSFPYDYSIVQQMRQLPHRFYHIDKKEWEVPVTQKNRLSQIFEDKDVETVDETAQKLVDYEYKTTPYPHQVEGFKYALTHDRWLLGDEMGLGKTKQVIDIATYLKQSQGYPHCLIVCGVNGLKWNWVDEIHTHSNEGAYILGQRRLKDKFINGSIEDRLIDLKQLQNDVFSISEYFIITNVETLRNTQIQAEMNMLCKKGIFGVIAADEIHKMKNPNSQQGKGFLKLSAPHMIAMTGTPLMNNPIDLYIILKWLGYETHSFYSFKSHFCVMGGYGGYQIVGYKNLDQLQAQLDSIMLRRKKEDVLTLPDKIYVDEYVEMGAKQAKIYREVTAELRENIDRIKLSPNPLASLIRLRQATGYPGILSSSVQESAKLDRMEELVDDSIANGRKVVVFSNWTQMTMPVYNRLSKKYKGTYITGETADAERQSRVIAFQNNKDCKFIVGTIGAMGTGITLTAGTVEIFLDEPWNMALKEQCIDRCHRIGQKNTITIYTILTKGTIDERVHEIITRKGTISDIIVNGTVKDHAEDVINFLIS